MCEDMASPEAECPKTVVCFGDSNTWGAWGHADKQGQRIPYYARWTTILQRRLGNGVSVVPEGLNGRTTVLDDPVSFLNSLPDTGTVNGSRYLPACLHSHKPIDLVVLGLGANDVKTRFSLSPAEIAKGCLMLIRMIKTSGCGPGGAPPALVLLSPPAMRLVEMHDDFGPHRAARSLAVIEAYRRLAEEEGAEFVSLADVPTSEDGLHFDVEASAAIGGLVALAAARALGTGPLQEPGAEPGPGAPKRPRREADRVAS